MNVSRKSLFFLSLLTIVGFSAIGFGILAMFSDESPFLMFRKGAPVGNQILYGSLFGALAVGNGVVLVKSPWMEQTRNFFAHLIRQLNPRIYHIIFYSICAAVGEEILFRGAIQYFLGIWWTSLIFILLHGYLNPYNWQITLYGVFMVMISAGLGYLYELLGIYAAMIAHFIYDVVMFIFLRRLENQLPEESEDEYVRSEEQSFEEW